MNNGAMLPQPHHHPIKLEADETALDFIRRVSANHLPTGLSFIDNMTSEGLSPNDVVEVYGDSGSSKTEVLLHATLNAVLSGNGGHRPRSVVYFDFECRFSSSRMASLCRNKILSRGHFGIVDDNQIDQKVEACLSRVLVFQCHSIFDFMCHITTLLHGSVMSEGAPLALVVIDSLASFYWEHKAAEASAGPGPALLSTALELLHRLAQQRCVPVVAAKPVLFRPQLPHCDYMPPMWRRLVTKRVRLTKVDTVERRKKKQQQQQQRFLTSSGGVEFVSRFTAHTLLPEKYMRTFGFSVSGAEGIECDEPVEYLAHSTTTATTAATTVATPLNPPPPQLDHHQTVDMHHAAAAAAATSTW